MQDKTINNALLALAKQGGSQGKLANVLLEVRGVDWSGIKQDQPLKRGGAKNVVLDALKQRPMSSSELGALLHQLRPEIGRKSANNRAYQALYRLRDNGVVRGDFGPGGCMGRLSDRVL